MYLRQEADLAPVAAEEAVEEELCRTGASKFLFGGVPLKGCKGNFGSKLGFSQGLCCTFLVCENLSVQMEGGCAYCQENGTAGSPSKKKKKSARLFGAFFVVAPGILDLKQSSLWRFQGSSGLQQRCSDRL